MQYRDAVAAINWLCDELGSKRHTVVPDDNGSIEHARRSFGKAMIMLGSAEDANIHRIMPRPDLNNATNTQSCYVFIEDVDAHCARTHAAYAEIVMVPVDGDYRGQLFCRRDPNGDIMELRQL